MKKEENNKALWRLNIALLAIILIVLAGSILVIIMQGGHLISGKEVAEGITFPWVVFVPIWVVIMRRKLKPNPDQERILKIMLAIGVILLVINVLLFLIL